MDHFALLLSNLTLFREDLMLRNRLYCKYLLSLDLYGLGDAVHGKTLNAVLRTGSAHQRNTFAQVANLTERSKNRLHPKRCGSFDARRLWHGFGRHS